MIYGNRLRQACRSVKFPLALSPNQARNGSRIATQSAPSATAVSACLSARAYHGSIALLADDAGPKPNRFHGAQDVNEELSPFKKQRKEDLLKASTEDEPLFTESYPRLEDPKVRRVSVSEFLEAFHSRLPDEEVQLLGRVRAKRIAGKGLIFLDVVNEFQKVQVMLSKNGVATDPNPSHRFRLFRSVIQVGDHICKSAHEKKIQCQNSASNFIAAVTGRPTRTIAGELTLKATGIPELMSPTMELIPDQLTDPQTKAQHRHLDMLVNREVTDVLRLRSEITRYMREYFYSKRFLEFQTPILAENAGGAVARPFVTRSTEFSRKDLAMRVAPELWLKRLVVGGIDKVFEIGPSFRNEGIDATHNPEFTMCEFYSAYTNLADLIKETEELICGLAERSSDLIKTQLTSLPEIDMNRFKRPFRQVEFVPELEQALGFRLPKLSNEDALPELLAMLKLGGISLPGEVPTTLPKLLDRLAAVYLEPKSFEEPVFITHHPSCMSPLSKSFICPNTYQLVSARAELFVGGRELANMYEEENDPESQKRKLADHRNLVNKPNGEIAVETPEPEETQEEFSGIETDQDGEASPLDASFIEALDYALPPTGGWGCGVERLVMLFSGASRISDCLSFGTLRNVVGLTADVEKSKKQSMPDESGAKDPGNPSNE